MSLFQKKDKIEKVDLNKRFDLIGRVGQGTRVDDISRARDAFLDERVRAATARTASSDINAELLSRIESLLGEPDFGVTAALDELWAGFEDLSLDPSDQGRRTAVRNQLDVVASRFNAISDGVDRLVADTSTRALGTITQINDLVAEVASLNEAIARSSANG